MANEREPVPSNNQKEGKELTKAEKRIKRLLSQLEEHWPELTAAGVASTVVGLGLALLWARKRIKERESREVLDEAVKEELLSDPESIKTRSKKIDNFLLYPLVSELGQRLGNSPLGQEIQIQLAFTRGLLGIRTTVEDTLEEELITAASYVASEGQKEIKALQAGKEKAIKGAPKER